MSFLYIRDIFIAGDCSVVLVQSYLFASLLIDYMSVMLKIVKVLT